MMDLAAASLAEAAVLVRDRRASPVELVDACIERIDRWEPVVEALVTRLDERAVKEAQEREREVTEGNVRGPLHGVPVMIKDMIDVEGVPTTASSKILRENVAPSDATVTARLCEAGAIVLAKTNTHEFAFGGLTPPTRNPWNPARRTGGSSGGSAAAVASEMAYGGLGTDTVSSVREPSCFCGLVGMKPSFGAVSRHGVIPLAWSLDTVGPMTRTVRDCALLLSVLWGSDPADLSSAPDLESIRISDPASLGGLRVAVASELMHPLESDVSAAIRRTLDALEDAGATIDEVSIGDPEEIVAVVFMILGSEAAAYHRSWYQASPDLYQDDVRNYLKISMGHPAVDYIDAQRLRVKLARRIDEITREADVVVAPGQMVTAPPLEAEILEFPSGERLALDLTTIRPLSPFSLSGHPAITVPIGLDASSLPIGLQLVGHLFGDADLLGVAQAVEALAGWTWRSLTPPT